MDELEKGLAISLHGQARADAIDTCRRWMETWQVALPPAEPLVLDFGLGKFGETGLVEYWIANETEAGYCGKYLFVVDGQTCPQHRHHTKHETFFVIKGRVRMAYGDQVLEMGEGDVLPVVPGRFHRFTGIGPALLLELSSPCKIDDNQFSDPRIPIGKPAAPCAGAEGREEGR